MTAYQNEGRVCRKSSVYNQTGETYFQQLSAYNHMCAHLRRVLLAPCVVDSRNKRYMRDRGLGRGRSGRSKSLDKIRMREDIIDGVAYDTEHHPLDVLRMSLECSADCRQRVKRVVDACKRCNDWSARSRAEFRSGGVAQRSAMRGKSGEATCRCLESASCKPRFVATSKRGSGKPIGSSGNTRRVVVPLIVNRGESKRSVGDRAAKSTPSRSEVGGPEPSYSYDSSFESSSEASSASGSPVLKKSASSRDSRAESLLDVADELNGQTSGISATAESAQEAKYAKFVYDVTQEIMINGLYTDDELRAVFRKHVDANSGTLDRNRMHSEIRELKVSLNLPEISDDENNGDTERFVDDGGFAKLTAEKPPTARDNKHAEKPRKLETIRFDETRKLENSHGKSAVVLADANPELLITERDVFLTLAEMKLDPRQIQRICKSLHDKSRVLTQTVQFDSETSYPPRRQDRADPLTSAQLASVKTKVTKTDESSEGKQPESTMKMSIRRSDSTLQTDDGHDDDSLFDFELETKSAFKNCESQKQLEKGRKVESVEHIAPTDTRDSSRDTEEPRISFVSHSEFLNNLKRDDASSLPDISERSEGVTGDIETVSDEILTVGSQAPDSQATPRRPQVHEADERFSEIDDAPVAEESSIISQSIEVFKVPSRVELAEAEGASKGSETSVIDENDEALPTPSLFQRESDDSENDEVVVASLESLSSPVISPKVSSSRLSPDGHKEEGFGAGESIVSLESSPRRPENTDDKSRGTPTKSAVNDSDRGRATPNSEDKDGDTLSIETELDQPEILSSKSEIQSNVGVKEETASVSSSVKKPEADEHGEESQKPHEFSEKSDDRTMTIDEVSKSETSVLRTESDFSESMKDVRVEDMESGTSRKGKKSINSGRFCRLISARMGHFRGNAKSQSDAKAGMSEKTSRATEKDEKQRRTKFANYPITTVSDISFLRKHDISNSAQSSIETFVDSPYMENESPSRNLKLESKKQSGNSIGKRMKAAMGHLIKRSSKSTEFRDEATQISPINAFITATVVQASEDAPSWKYMNEKLPSALAAETQHSSCLCVLASALVESNKNENCRSDCRGRPFVCDNHCSKFYPSFR